ncbi:MAG: 4'-phosphopantetheinyl transferase superfamily protein [Lachnospiraceae bacterium]|nr:4'-phosphopantetheinyl transferase superfamily protein [Lachnospiraceae bacterium]
MKKTTVGTTTICLVEIESAAAESGRTSRREREKAAVRLAAENLGVEIGHAPDGAPTCEGYSISVTHSQDLAAVAIDPARRIGIDAETWREALRRTRPKYLSEREIGIYADESSMLWAWTVKEAVYKSAPAPKPFMSEIECDKEASTATAHGHSYTAESWMEGNDRLTLVYPTGK